MQIKGSSLSFPHRVVKLTESAITVIVFYILSLTNFLFYPIKQGRLLAVRLNYWPRLMYPTWKKFVSINMSDSRLEWGV